MPVRVRVSFSLCFCASASPRLRLSVFPSLSAFAFLLLMACVRALFRHAEYFGQFGRVTKIRMSRSKKTGASRHYAFLEFYSPEVAKIAADSMNGYIFFGRRLQCHLVPRAKVHPELWTGHDRRFRVVPWRRLERERRAEVEATEGHLETKAKRAAKRDRKRKEKVKESGIDYEWAGHADAAPKAKKKASKVVFE